MAILASLQALVAGAPVSPGCPDAVG